MEQSCREKVTKGFLRIIPRGKENEPTNTREALRHVTSVRLWAVVWLHESRLLKNSLAHRTQWIWARLEMQGLSNSRPEAEKYSHHFQKEQLAIGENWYTPKDPTLPKFSAESEHPVQLLMPILVFQKYSVCFPSLEVEQLLYGENTARNTLVVINTDCAVSIRGFSFSCFLWEERNKLVMWCHVTREQSAYSSKLRKWKTVQRSYLSWGNMQSLTLVSGLVLCLHCTSAMAARVLALTYNFMQILGQKTSRILWFHFAHHDKTHSNLLMMLIFTS